MIQANAMIEPLREDLCKILNGLFLVSTSFKRFLLINKINELWANALDIAENKMPYIVYGYQYEV